MDGEAVSNIPKEPSQEVLNWIRAHWKISPQEGEVFGCYDNEIGSLHPSGYVFCTAFIGKHYRIKRSHLIWWAYHNSWPKISIDHDNRIKTNDWIGNLKEATSLEQMANTSQVINKNKGLPVGVTFRKCSGKYSAHMGYKGKLKWLGNFDNPEEAHRARLTYEKEMSHG